MPAHRGRLGREGRRLDSADLSTTPDGTPAPFAQPWSEVLIESPREAGSVMADGQRAADAVVLHPGIVQHFVRWAREHQLLPEAYLYGLAFTDRFSRNRLAFFAGEFRESGWREFFPAAFLLKTTLPTLAAGALALLALTRLARRRRSVLYRLAPLVVFAVVYGGFAISSSLNIGHRHLLPLYPVLYIAAGAAVHFSLSRVARAALLALVLWQGVEAWRVHPHYLTYFNQIAGGPAKGHRFLVDSSLDWGQGLPDLARWLETNAGHPRVYLSYFGSDEPARFGLRAIRIGDVYFDYAPTRVLLPTLEPGLYCVSATMLRRVYTQVRGPWSESYERAYRDMQRWLADQPPGASARRGPDGRELSSDEWQELLVRFEQLRFGRLCRYLERRAPDAIVANSILVYRLDADELARALWAPPIP